jgi:hypothetical protein
MVKGPVLDPVKGLVGQGPVQYVGLPAPPPVAEKCGLGIATAHPCPACKLQDVQRPVVLSFCWILNAIGKKSYVPMRLPVLFEDSFLLEGGRIPVTSCPSFQLWWQEVVEDSVVDYKFDHRFWDEKLQGIWSDIGKGKRVPAHAYDVDSAAWKEWQEEPAELDYDRVSD